MDGGMRVTGREGENGAVEAEGSRETGINGGVREGG